MDPLGVVLDRCVVDSDAGWDASFELCCRRVVEKQVAAELVIFPGRDDLASAVVLLEGFYV